ncbi:hypothetical protein CCM_07259 [Cordyceps militaris CM01]|uniref:Uncharacterized protein n=1 Tax=Cordyceps militaris (strain CM01) TaxID=983644 RepID=G3JMG0_CORMM|nr:uncharacterized protein CCM_07259 [Cordyceps militaris CM01]EGX90839.1 hypothetical protein CCM_07259 [Cordyceps militaris CM01]
MKASGRMGCALPRLPSGGLQRLDRFRHPAHRLWPVSRHGTRPRQPVAHLLRASSSSSPSSTRMLSSTPVSSGRVTPDVERLRRQPAKVTPDYLTPMPSHLLTTMLADLEDPRDRNTSPATLARGPGGPGAPSSSPTVQSPPRPLPQGHHLVYFPLQAAPSRLAPDGADLDHSPGAHYSRRLWAGGEVTFRHSSPQQHRARQDDPNGDLLLDGSPWTCTETIGDVRVKEASQPLADTHGDEKVFVDVWRRYALGHPRGHESLPWSIEERRTLVFMNPGENAEAQTNPTPKIVKCEFFLPVVMTKTCPSTWRRNQRQTNQHATTPDPHEAAHSVQVLPSPRHLFYFSALTFNAHAIHLDPQYARSVDGHRAPLVHGPLTLALMLRVLTGYSGQLVSRFVYRNHAPLYVDEPLTVKVRPVASRTGGNAQQGDTWDAWVEGPDGGLAAKGTATMAGRAIL